jgi:hypothetical protein
MAAFCEFVEVVDLSKGIKQPIQITFPITQMFHDPTTRIRRNPKAYERCSEAASQL